VNQQYDQPYRPQRPVQPRQPGYQGQYAAPERRSPDRQAYPTRQGQYAPRQSGQPGYGPRQNRPAPPAPRAGQGEFQRPANPRRRRRKRHPYAHLVKPALIAFAVLVLLVLAIVDYCSFKLVADTDTVITAEFGQEFSTPDLGAKLRCGIFGIEADATVTVDSRVDTSSLGDKTVQCRLEGKGLWLLFPRTLQETVNVTVRVVDTTAPVITLRTSDTPSTLKGAPYVEEGFTATDACDGDVTALVTAKQEGDQVFYSVTDSSGNTATAVRQILYREGTQANGKVIYLTFDDGPGKYTDKLLDVLAKYNVKVTFFVVGTDYPSIMKRIAEEGHAIGVHSYTHRLKLIYQSEDHFFTDMEQMQELIVKYTGKRTNLLRFPGGSSNRLSDYNPGIMSRLSKSVVERGYYYFDWNVDSCDASRADTPEEVFQYVKEGCEGREKSVVLQHDIKDYSVDAVEMILKWGLENGYTFLPLDPSAPGCHHKISN